MGNCDSQGHHAFGKYLILFMIIYMMVKLGLVFMIFENGESFEILCCDVQVI